MARLACAVLAPYALFAAAYALFLRRRLPPADRPAPHPTPVRV